MVSGIAVLLITAPANIPPSIWLRTDTPPDPPALRVRFGMLRVTNAALNVSLVAGNVNERPSMGVFGIQFEHWVPVVW